MWCFSVLNTSQCSVIKIMWENHLSSMEYLLYSCGCLWNKLMTWPFLISVLWFIFWQVVSVLCSVFYTVDKNFVTVLPYFPKTCSFPRNFQVLLLYLFNSFELWMVLKLFCWVRVWKRDSFKTIGFKGCIFRKFIS